MLQVISHVARSRWPQIHVRKAVLSKVKLIDARTGEIEFFGCESNRRPMFFVFFLHDRSTVPQEPGSGKPCGDQLGEDRTGDLAER